MVIFITPFICAFREESSQDGWSEIIDQTCLF
jgi:hypothetical protein